jgi:amino acid adenylation domain-containing protein
MSSTLHHGQVEDVYPLAPMQQGMLFHTLAEPGSGVYVEQIRLGLEGLDADCFRRAWEAVFARFTALRTSIVGSGRRQPAQVVRRRVDLPWREHDLRDLATQAERSARIDAFLREDGARGFTLQEPTLVRLDLFRTGAASHELVWTLHHLVLDGWSGSLVLRDVLACYRALRRGEEPRLPAVRPYRDFIEWLGQQDLGRAQAYWRGALAGAPGAPALDGDRGRNGASGASACYAREERRLPAAQLEALRRGAGAARVTLNTLLQGAFSLALGRSGGHDDVVFGTVSSGRPEALAGVESMVGLFVNTLPLRVRLPADTPPGRWLTELQACQAEQREYEYSPLWEVQTWAGLAPGQRLFECLFVFENYPVDRDALAGGDGLSVRVTAPFDRTGYPLMLLATPTDGLELQLTYDAERFAAPAMGRLLDHVVRLADGLARGTAATLGDVDLPTQPERELVLREWNATARDYPVGACLHDLVAAQAEATPDATAVVCGDERVPYAELLACSQRLARHLRALGVGRGDRVGLCVERSPAMIEGVLGIHLAGGAYVPLDPAYPADRLAVLLADSSADVVVVHGRTRAILEALPPGDGRPPVLACLDRDAAAIAQQPSAAPAPLATPDDLAYVLYTSGSTGRPKGVAMPHAPLVNLMHWQREQSGPGAGRATLQFAPLGFDVSCQEIYSTLGTGGTLCLVDEHERRDAVALLDALERYRVNRLFLPFVALRQLASVALDRERVPGDLDEVITAGEQLVVGPALAEFFARLPGCRLVNQYGPTECHVVSSHTLTGPPDSWPKLPPIGRPIANVRLYVLDERLRPVLPGMAGELCVGGAALARGYLGDEARTAASFVPDPFSDRPGARLYRTGDRARFLGDGTLEFLGRGDDQVKLRGFRVELGELESVAAALPGVAQAAALVREDRPGDRRLVLCYVAAPGGPSPASLRELLRARLPDHVLPAGCLRVERLPLTPSGKVDRRALASADYAPAELRAGSAPPRGPVEELLAEIWSEVLGVRAPGVHDDFFDLGGHSLTATQLVSRVRDALRVELPLRALFENPTIAGLAAAVAERKGSAATAVPLLHEPRAGDQPLSYAQQRLWFLDQMGTEAAYNMPWAFRLQGRLDGDALGRALQAIVDRHESLRTCFVAVDGKPAQRVLPELAVPLRRVDLAALEPQARAAELERLARLEAETTFDLARGPLIRTTLVRLGPEEHVLFLSLHHIVFDGWSIGVLNRELLELYRADLAGEAPRVPELAIQYVDFVDWQSRWLPGEVLERQMAYWRGKLTSPLPVLDLPTDRPRPPVQTYRGEGHVLKLPPELAGALRLLSRRQGVTLAMTLLAAFKALLARYTGQDDILVGMPIANRTRRELEDLIGFFVNSLVLRSDLSGDPPFTELLARVHATALEAYEHQDLPFERLVDELQPVRDPSRNPLFQVVFAMQNAPSRPLELPGLSIRPLEAATRATRFDLELHVTETPEGLFAGFCYNRSLFDAATIRRLGQHFTALLQGVVADPRTPISRLPMLLEDERRTLLEEWNDVTRRFPVDACLHQRFEAQVDRSPDAVAVTCGGERLTYAQLDARANRLAHVLRAHGVGPDVLVGLCLDRNIDLVVGILAVLKAGGGYVPLDLANPAERIAFILQDSRVPVLLTESAQLHRLPAHAAQVVCVDRDRARIAEASEARLAPLAEPRHVAYVIYTSGSTGQPKGVLVEHASVVRLFDATHAFYGFDAHDVWTLFHSCAFDFSVWEMWGALLYGGRLVVVPYLVSRSPDEFRRLLAREGVTVLNQTPSAFRQLIAADRRLDGQEALALRWVVFGGEALELQSLAPWFERHGDERPRLVNMYGITETTVHVTWRELRRADLHAAPGSLLGRPIPDVQVYVLDAHRQPVPIGVPGELYVGGAGVARGYLHRPELTDERFVPDPFRAEPGARLYRTGDLARWLPGCDLEFLGRNDEQVKIRGYRIELGEIEAALNAHPWVAESAVALVPGEDGERRLVGYVVPEQAGSGAEESELVSQWKALYEDTYSSAAPGQAPDFDIIGWNSSYTQAPIPAAEMREWVDETVAPILAARPARVLEIGCGTGLLLFRIAPHVQRYLGVDFSQKALDKVGSHVRRTPGLASKVELRRGVAHELQGVEPAGFDAVILNSVVQYFPSMAYLVKVLEGAVAATAPGGRVHVGDVRNLRLLEACHASVDPAFFLALREHLPRIGRVEISPKRGAARNELGKFRYQVTLHVEERAARAAPGACQDWPAGGGVAALARRLRDEAPEWVGLRHVPNARTLEDCAAAGRLRADKAQLSRATAAELRAELAARCAGQGVDPHALCALEQELPYTVSLDWAMPSEDGSFDVQLVRRDSGARRRLPEPPAQRRAWEQFGNHPLQARMTRQLAPRLRESLERGLPGYMVPSAFVMLESLPLTANGKVDRKALPDPEWFLTQRQGDYVAPRSATQKGVAEIWCELLGVEQLGLWDDFFDLGGHSLLAVQVMSRIRERFGVELGIGQIFESPTLEELAAAIDVLAPVGSGEAAGTRGGPREVGEL